MIVPALTPGDVFAEKYRVLRPLREGGDSELFAVETIPTGVQRLLQRVPPLGEHLPRFAKKVRVWADAAEEAGTVLVDEGIDGDVAWLVWELPEGETLAERVARAGALGAEEARPVIVQLGQALAKLHARGVVHRDVRPEGVHLARPKDPDGPPRVLLVGHVVVDRLVGDAHAMVLRSAVDEWSWSAAEIVGDVKGVTVAADVWPYALVAFWSLTGRPYWKAIEATALAREMLLEPLAPASERAAELGFDGHLPPGFDAWFAACVCRDRSTRIGEAGAATRAFRALFEPDLDPPVVLQRVQPILANPKGSHYDDGLQDPPPSQPGGSGGPYRGGRREQPRDHVVLANPKGSYYDAGLIRVPRRWPVVIAFLALVAGAVIAVLRLLRR